jgi:hypothetical protein
MIIGMTSNNKRLTFFEKLAELMKIAPENHVFEVLNKAIDNQLEIIGTPKEREIVLEIQTLVEQEYRLSSGALKNCFSTKKRILSDPKKMWVLVVSTVISDTDRLPKLIGNGLGRVHIYRYQSEFVEMKDLIPHHKDFKEKFKKIIESYGEKSIL